MTIKPEGGKKVWICNVHKEHVFNEPTADEWCPICGDVDLGILVETWVPIQLTVSILSPSNNQVFKEGEEININAEVDPDTDIQRVEFFVDFKKIGQTFTAPYSTTCPAPRNATSVSVKAYTKQGETATSPVVNIRVTPPLVGPDPIHKVGLSVILMDASESMEEPISEGSKITKLKLVAMAAASGIMDLERMQNNPYALVAAFKFDDRLEPLFIDSVANLISKFNKDRKLFANYIHDELKKMGHGTDINQALMHAHSFVDKFLRNQLTDLPINNYKVMIQTVFKRGSSDSLMLPNVRVLLYTDGKQFDKNKGRILFPNPFTKYPLDGLNHDIVIGAFFGNETDDGCKELQSLLSKCPIHDELQFFLFDNPNKSNNLKYLFRMASGTSGFCPICLDKEMNKNEMSE